LRLFSHVPAHGSREILIIMGSLTTCDPGDIYDTINGLVNENIRVSVVGLAAEIQICKHMCKKTRGTLIFTIEVFPYKKKKISNYLREYY
jgi:transcription initiation factor TFIIH subunit 2